MRNPWGSESYHGPWSDASELWNDTTKTQAGWVEEKEGAFFMPFDLFHQHFGYTYINYDPDDLFRDDWLQLNDSTSKPG